MKIEFPVSFEFVPPELPDDRVDNVALTSALIVQAYGVFANSFQDWIEKNHPCPEVFREEEGLSFSGLVNEIIKMHMMGNCAKCDLGVRQDSYGKDKTWCQPQQCPMDNDDFCKRFVQSCSIDD